MITDVRISGCPKAVEAALLHDHEIPSSLKDSLRGIIALCAPNAFIVIVIERRPAYRLASLAVTTARTHESNADRDSLIAFDGTEAQGNRANNGADSLLGERDNGGALRRDDQPDHASRLYLKRNGRHRYRRDLSNSSTRDAARTGAD